MSNVKLFDVRHSNDECQNELNVKLFDVQHSNVKDLAVYVQHSSVECQITNVKLT